MKGDIRAPSGERDLDELINRGFRRSELIILAENPGMDKTIFLTYLLRNGMIDYEKRDKSL